MGSCTSTPNSLITLVRSAANSLAVPSQQSTTFFMKRSSEVETAERYHSPCCRPRWQGRLRSFHRSNDDREACYPTSPCAGTVVNPAVRTWLQSLPRRRTDIHSHWRGYRQDYAKPIHTIPWLDPRCTAYHVRRVPCPRPQRPTRQMI